MASLRDGGSPEPGLRLRLYIVEGAPNSQRALANLNLILEGADEPVADLEVIDLGEDPGRALADGVLLTPTLVRLGPGPRASIVGDLRDLERVRQVLRIGSRAHGG